MEAEMPIHQRRHETKQGPLDAARHRTKQREAIKRGMRDIVADESIITRRKDEKVKVPIRGIKSYKFRHGSPDGEGAGAGQGKGQPGDVIGRKPGRGKPGQAGDKPGEDYIESEIELSELVRYMLEDMGLPNLQTKEVAKLVTPEGWTFRSVSKSGLRPNIEKKRTMREGMKRLIHFIEELKRETGRTDEECETALELAHGDINEALEMLRDPGFAPEVHREASAVITQDDLRYRTMEEDQEHHSNAVVLAMMDVSGSMGVGKKYIARSFFFWLVEILRHMYENVEIRFITHTTEARMVDEYRFFHKGESGGTFCHTAFDLAADLVGSQYPTSKYNVYPFLFSDGDDWRPDYTVKSIRRLLEQGVNMVGYGEIMEGSVMSNLMRHAENVFALRPVTSKRDQNVVVSESATHQFLAVLFENEREILPAIKEFLRKERWQ
jgi:sporulation protein YhbH